MLGLAAAAVTAAASLYSAYSSNQQRSQAAGSAQAFNQAQATAANQMSWDMWHGNNAFALGQEERAREDAHYMANTSYQRGMADMRAAGLNPLLAYGQGGATSPVVQGHGGGGNPSPSRADAVVPRIEQVLGPAVSAAWQTAQVIQGLETAQQGIKRSEAETRLLSAQESRTHAETLLRTAETARSEADAARLRHAANTEALRGPQVAAETAGTVQRTQTEAARTDQERQEADFMRRFGRRGHVGDAASSAATIGERAREIIDPRAAGAGAAVGGAARQAVEGAPDVARRTPMPNASGVDAIINGILRSLW